MNQSTKRNYEKRKTRKRIMTNKKWLSLKWRNSPINISRGRNWQMPTGNWKEKLQITFEIETMF